MSASFACRHVLCMGCRDVLTRTLDMDPAVPLQYCDRPLCQKLSTDHQTYIEEHANG